MNKLPTKLIATVTFLAMVGSSLASESTANARVLPIATGEARLTAPTVLSQKLGLTTMELVKYQRMADQSRSLAARRKAGASSATKTVLIVVGTVVVVIGVLALVVTHGGQGILSSEGYAK